MALLTLFVCLFFLLPRPLLASQPVELNGNETALSLQAHSQFLRDPSGTMQLEEVLSRLTAFEEASTRRDLNFSYTHDHVWLHMELTSRADSRTDWVIEMRYSSLDRVSLFLLAPDGSWSAQHAGDTLPFAERSIGHRNPVFTLTLEPGDTRTLLLRANSEGNLTLDGLLWQAEHFTQQSNSDYVLVALYFGMLLALGGYNLLLFLALRERSFLLYVCFVVSFGTGMLAINGLGAQYLWPDLGEHGNRIMPFSLCLSAAVGVLFAQSFLDTARRATRVDAILTVWAWIAMIATLTILVLPVQLALQLMSLVGLITTLVLFFAGTLCVIRRVPGSAIFVIAWLMLLIGGMLLALRNFGVIPSNFLTVNAMQIGSAMEMLLLSLGLAARFNEMKRLKEQAQKEALLAQRQVVRSLMQQEKILEKRVSERTEALAQANAQLELLAMQDPLTGLANRTALAQHMQQAMLRTERREEWLALVLIDLDAFKAINDEMGHDAGDQVLVEAAKRLRECARETDLVARLGGDEFILVSEGIVDREDALSLGERLLDALSMPIMLTNGSISVGASIGISLSNGIEPDIESMMRQADQAMYQRKRSGRHGVVIYSAPGKGSEQPA